MVDKSSGFVFLIVGEYESGCTAMTTQRKSAKLQLRRSISEQLRDSTSKAWDLLWRNVRERRLAGQSQIQICGMQLVLTDETA